MMPTIYQKEDLPLVVKFGGTITDQLKFEGLISVILDLRQQQLAKKVICVLSAQGDLTKDLIEISDELGQGIVGPPRDALITNGENMSVAKAWLVAEKMGLHARGVTAWQIGLNTSKSIGGRAFIKTVDQGGILRMLQDVEILFVPGFQGISPEGHVVTLCRGGSDITAVAIAAALGVPECFIFTDKEGIYQIDPSLGFDKTKILKDISYDQAIELGWLGMKIIHPRATVIAKRNQISIRVVHGSIDRNKGTRIHNAQKKEIPVLAMTENEARLELEAYNDTPGILASIYRIICKAGLDLDLFYQGPKDIFFAVNTENISSTALDRVIRDIRKRNLCKNVKTTSNLSKISVVTNGLASSPGITNEVIKKFIINDLNFLLLGGPRNRLSVLVPESSSRDALQYMHDMFVNNSIIQ